MKFSRLLVFLAGLLLLVPFAQADFFTIFSSHVQGGAPPTVKTVFITAGSSWTVPNDFTPTNTFVAIGAGAGGGGGNSGQGGGGGGGAFATISNIVLTPGGSVSISIGQGGAGATNAPNAVAGDGTDTIFNTVTPVLLAKGGVHGVFSSGPKGGAGGAAASSTPTTGAQSGGKGADIPSAAGSGAGGGGAGGPNGAGAAGGTISSSASSQGGSGGGASDGGSIGGSVTASLNGGAGGAAFDSTAGGTGGTGGASPTAGGTGSHGSGGGGGGGSATASVTTAAGGVGGTSVDYTQTSDSAHAGPGGGGGGAGGSFAATSTAANGAAGGLYGGGGGAGGAGTTAGAGGAGANGIIIVTYTAGAGGGNPPAAPGITSPITGATINTAAATLTGSGSNTADTINITLDGTLFTAATSVTSNGTWTYTTAQLANSSHTVSATETNANGTSSISNIVTFTTNVTVPTTSTLDPAKTTNTITLSNGNLTSAVTATGTCPQSLSTTGFSTGKLHFELQLTGSGNTQQGTGLAQDSPAHLRTACGGSDAASIALYGGTSHQIQFNGVAVVNNTGLTVNAGDLIAVEVDLSAGKFWVQDVTTGGGWNGNNATNNPGTGTGGATIPTGVVWYALDEPVQGVVAGRSQTINLGGSAFTLSCSTGFTPWNGSLTACPSGGGGGSSGTGLSTPVSLLPSNLPNIPSSQWWHTTARPWSASTITASTVLGTLNNMVGYYVTKLDGAGCFVANIDPYSNSAAGPSGGSMPLSIGAQLAAHNQANLAVGVLSMNCDTAGYAAHTAVQDFFIGPINLGLQLYINNAGAVIVNGSTVNSRVAGWKASLNHWYGVGNNTTNWGTYDMWGAWLGVQNGLSAFSGATGTAGIDCMWTGCSTTTFNTFGFNISHQMNDPPLNLYMDQNGVTPDGLQVERQSTTLLLMNAEGYNGAQAGAIKTATQTAARSGMLMQGADGSNAVGGRVDDHTWVDAGRVLTNDIMAQLTGATDSFVAGQFQRSANLAYQQMQKYLNAACCNGATFFITKNHYNPTPGVGYQFGSGGDYGYNTQLMYFLAGAYLYHSSSTVAEQPAPFEIGGYSFATNSDFGPQVSMDAGGTSLQAAMAGSTSLTTFDTPTLWTALGIERIGRVGWETRLGPPDAGYTTGLGNQTSFGPTWNTSGSSWTRLAQNPSSCTGSFTTTFANPAVTFGKIVWTCSGRTFTQNLTVTADGVLSQTTCSGCTLPWGMTFPVLVNDGDNGFGNTATTTSINSGGNGIVSILWPSNSDQQNYITISGSPTCTTNESNQVTIAGTITPVRTVTGTGTGCSTPDATQTTFVYPRNSSDPSASSVRSAMNVTGTNTYTNTALSSYVVSTTNGTYYVGRTAAGGWASTANLNGGATIAFTASGTATPCNFIAQVNGSNQVTSLEVDRNITATYVGANGTHTNVSLTAYTPVTNQ